MGSGFTRRLGEHGWLGADHSERVRGHDPSHLERYVVTEELLAARAPVAAHWVADRQVGPSLMRRHRLPAQALICRDRARRNLLRDQDE